MTLFPTLIAGTLTLATYTSFAPFCWQDGTGAHGKDIDFLRRFAQHAGLNLSIRFYDVFDGIWARPGRDEADLAAASIAPLNTRDAAGVIWSEPYTIVRRSLLIRSTDAGRYTTIADFDGGTIGVTRGSTADHDTQQRKLATTRLVYCPSQHDAVRDLLAHRIDAYGTGELSSRYLIDQHPGQFELADVHPMTPPETFAFAVRAASGIHNSLNAFIREHRETY